VAQDAELLLKVGLDLSHFRGQLNRLGTDLAGQSINLSVKFDRTKIVSEFRLLNRYISDKKFYVEVNTNLKKELERAQELARTLATMPPASAGKAGVIGQRTAGGAARVKELQNLTRILVREGGFDKNAIRRVAQTAIDEGIGGIDLSKSTEEIKKQLRQGFELAADDANKGLINKLLDGTTEAGQAAAKMGNAVLEKLRTSLDTRSPSKKTEKIGKDTGEGLVLGIESSIAKGETRISQALDRLLALLRSAGRSLGFAFETSFEEGRRAATRSGVRGGALGALGGGATGAIVGGAKGIGAGVTGGLTKLGGMGVLGVGRQLGRLSIGDTAGLTGVVQEVSLQALHKALEVGGEAMLIGALGVGGVAALAGFARGSTKSLAKQSLEGINATVQRLIQAGQRTITLDNIVKVVITEVGSVLLRQAGNQAKLAAQKSLPAISWPAVTPQRVFAGPSSSGRLLSAAPPEASPAGLLPSISRTSAQKASVATGLQAIFAAGGPMFPEGPSGKLALSIETLKKRVDAILASYFKVVEIKVAEIFDGQVLKTELKSFDRFAQNLQGASQYAAQIAAKMIPPITGRLLAPGRQTGGGIGAQEQVVRNFYEQLRKSTQMFAEAFSANSYLPQSTRKLADAMNNAATTLRALSAGKIAGVLPSREMLDARKFASAIQKAIVIDFQNAIATQMSGRLLPAAGGTKGFQRMLADQPSYRAPEVGAGRAKIDMTGKVLPLEERQKFQEAINKAAAIDARNAARAAFVALRQELNRGLLPGAGQTFASKRKDPGVQGIFNTIAQQMGFSAGQRYAMGGSSQLRLPPAGMTGANAAQEDRIRRAYERSAERERAVLEQEAGIIGFRRSLERGGGGGGGGGFTGQGYVPPGGFPSDTLPLGGRQGPATFIGPGSQMEKFKTVLDVASASMKNFRASQVPLLGGLREIGGEFLMATKQVLLYGTAYKGLAFITSLPGQVLNAAKSQQQYNNALQTATQDTGTFAKELLYVDNVQRAFGLNLETTRTGFTRLYASMAPTGFDSGSIEKLFTGISAATAALQLTPDKAERVIYAFGQMASKGQIMSEELKGQLGDVLPGALAIFAKAAGMSVKDFSKAMEDGVFVGGKFREVFAKVSDELMNRFGTGAQAAGRSLQGLLNTVGGDFQRTLESFAPLANAAAQAILGPLGGAMREISAAAQIAMGEQDRVRKQLEAAQSDVSALKTGGADAKEIKAAEQNVAALTAKYESLNEAAKDPAIAQQVKNIEAFVAEIQKAATFTMNLAGIIRNVFNPLFTFLGGNLTSVIGNLALLALGFNAAKLAALLFMGTLNTMKAVEGISRSAAAGATVLAAAYRALGVQATGAQIATLGATGATTAFGLAIKGLLIGTGIGAVVVLLGSLAAAFLSVGNSAKEAADRAKQAIDSMADARRTGNVAMIERTLAENKADRQDLEGFIQQIEGTTGTKRNAPGGKVVEFITLTPAQKREAERLGVEVGEEATKGFLLGSLNKLKEPLEKVETEGRADLEVAKRRAAQLGLNKPDPAATQAENTLQDTKTTNLESYYNLQDQLAKAFTQAEIDRIEQLHEHRMSMINAEFDLQEARANSFQKAAIRLQKELSQIEMERQSALLKARSAVLLAQGSVAGGAALPGTVATTGGALSQDALTRGRSTGPHLHAQAAGMTEKTLRYLVDKYLEIGGKAASSFGTSRGAAGHGYNAIDYLTPQGTPIALKPGASIGQYGQVGGRGGLMAQVTTPEGNFQLGHLASLAPEAVGPGAPRKVPGSEKRDALAAQQVEIAQRKENLILLQAEEIAYGKIQLALENYVASIFSPAEQKLQNSLLAERNRLEAQGLEGDDLDAAMQKYEIQERINAGIAEATRVIEENNQKVKDGIITTDEANKRNKIQNDLIEKLRKLLPEANKLIDENNLLKKEGISDKVIANLKEELKLLRAISDEEERRLRIRQENKGISKEKEDEIYRLQEVKRNLEQTRALIDDFVKSTSNDYKGFLKAVIKGEDATDALKQFQEALTDRVLTIFLDFTMAPVEKFFQESLRDMFLPKNIPGIDEEQKKAATPVEANTNATIDNTKAIKELTNAIGGGAAPSGQTATTAVGGLAGLLGGAGVDMTGVTYAQAMGDTSVNFAGISEQLSSLTSVQEDYMQSIAATRDVFSNATFGISQQTEMASNVLAAGTQETQRQGSSFGQALGRAVQTLGAAAGSVLGIAAGVQQIQSGGTSGVLGGIGSILMSVAGLGSAFSGLGGLFGGGGGGGSLATASNNLSGTGALRVPRFLGGRFGANGGIATGGWEPFPVTPFANGGMVTGPTLGLVGEGRYNEAIVPLPDGRSIPVQLQDTSIRDRMGNTASNNATTPVLSMSFQSTTINGVEYVDRAQLEVAMAETRRIAVREGASRGATIALDRLANSPNSRRRIGLR